jgi:hypothetical protein
VWGQSAGAHLAACAVIERAVCETLERATALAASPLEHAAPDGGRGVAEGRASRQAASVVSLCRLRTSNSIASLATEDGCDEDLPDEYDYGPLVLGPSSSSDAYHSSHVSKLPPQPPLLNRKSPSSLLVDSGGFCLSAYAPSLEMQPAPAHANQGRHNSGGRALGADAGSPPPPTVTEATGATTTAMSPPRLVSRFTGAAGAPGWVPSPPRLVSPASALGRASTPDAEEHSDDVIVSRTRLLFPASSSLGYEQRLIALRANDGAAPSEVRSVATAPEALEATAMYTTGRRQNALMPAMPLRPRIRRFFGVSGTYDVGAIVRNSTCHEVPRSAGLCRNRPPLIVL